jgi:hypothetical protein
LRRSATVTCPDANPADLPLVQRPISKLASITPAEQVS